MIRAWLSTARRRAAALRGEREWRRDRRRHPDERIALRDELIAELRGRVSALETECAVLKVATSDAVMRAGLEHYLQQGRSVASRLDGPTVVMRADQMQRPAAPTEQWRTR